MKLPEVVDPMVEIPADEEDVVKETELPGDEMELPGKQAALKRPPMDVAAIVRAAEGSGSPGGLPRGFGS